MERDLVINGVRIGEYEVTPETIMKKLKEEVIAYGMNYAEFSCPGTDFGKAFYEELADLLVENEIYMQFGCHVIKDENPTGFDDETAQMLKEKMGKYMRPVHLAELGTKFAATASGYMQYVGHGIPAKSKDLQECVENFKAYCREKHAKGSLGGKFGVTNVDSTQLISYANYTDAEHPTVEMCNGNPEIMAPLTRAVARALGKDFWATYIAHEWYAGTKTLDPLKIKRLKLYYDYCYMSGSNGFVLESGDELLAAHDTDLTKTAGGAIAPKDTPYGYDHPVCQNYRNVLRNFAKFVKEDFRPKGGPKVKVAFVQGNCDGYTHWRAGSSVWHVFDDPNYGYSTPEFVWRIFDDLGVKRRWWEGHNFGEHDLSGAPAYGTYDIVPAWAGYEAFSRYEYLIFTGWNSMTEEIYEDLKKYVYNGGKLLISAAHLNTATKRDGEIKLIHDGKVSELFGCDLDVNEKIFINDGSKFIESIVPGVQYPASFRFDPLFSEGYVNYPKVTLTTASPAGRLSRSFGDPNPEMLPVSVAENKYGKGYTILMTTLDYPSAGAYPTYRNIVREILTATHRACDIKVYGGDRLRFTVYEGNKIYLLNTDMDCSIEAVIEHGDQRLQVSLAPLELKPIQL